MYNSVTWSKILYQCNCNSYHLFPLLWWLLFTFVLINWLTLYFLSKWYPNFSFCVLFRSYIYKVLHELLSFLKLRNIPLYTPHFVYSFIHLSRLYLFHLLCYTQIPVCLSTSTFFLISPRNGNARSYSNYVTFPVLCHFTFQSVIHKGSSYYKV